jgi:hypothetical protein
MENKGKQYPTLLDRAIEFAVQQHAGQYRNNGTTPYIMHPLDGLKRLIDKGVEKERLLAGFTCHDVVEDTGCTYDQLAAELGTDVANLVMEVTKMGIDDQTIGEKLAFIKAARHKSLDALLLKIQDRFCNFKDYQKAKRLWYPGYYALQAYTFYDLFLENKEKIVAEHGQRVFDAFLTDLNEMDQVVFTQYGVHLHENDKHELMDSLLLKRDKGIFGK